ncbi:MAG TPA: hypothetical protein VNE62_07725 [Actinomycetota bacterium]|nr:hypothetical protein [Actinomycetota bacterium]
MRARIGAVCAIACLGWAAASRTALAQQVKPEDLEPRINWVFIMSLLILAGFLAFLFFAFVYYLLGVLVRNRRFATPAVVASPLRASAAAPTVPTAPSLQQQAPAQPAAPASVQAAPSPAGPAPPVAAPTAAAPTPAPPRPASAPAGGVPKIDPNRLPDGIDAVARGRLKKLAVLQERGQAPPAALIDELKPILEQMTGSSIDTTAATAAPAPAAPDPAPAAPAPAPAAPAAGQPAPEQPAPVPVSEPPPAEAVAPDVTADAGSPQQQVAAPAQDAQPAPPAADTGDLPRVDPNNLPSGIDAVMKGRLKKLAILQERGKAPPADLVEQLRPILDQMKGS